MHAAVVLGEDDESADSPAADVTPGDPESAKVSSEVLPAVCSLLHKPLTSV
jgi:hypothetical protein